MMAWPKPVQKPHPPVLVGGAFPYGARRAIRYGDGWMPLRARAAYTDVRALFPKFREMAKAANRDLATLPISIWNAPEDESELKRDQDEGVERIIISLESAKADEVLPVLDRWTKLMQKVG
jgi:alkanesulfonate monooxygenase SsuD/methylene tetrahydromethanopterin reductase-like flavin-dependent oxidoreductase (luciferase family)